MSDIPLPQPLTDDEAAELDYLYENYEADHREGQWADALEWARKGRFCTAGGMSATNRLPA